MYIFASYYIGIRNHFSSINTLNTAKHHFHTIFTAQAKRGMSPINRVIF